MYEIIIKLLSFLKIKIWFNIKKNKEEIVLLFRIIMQKLQIKKETKIYLSNQFQHQC